MVCLWASPLSAHMDKMRCWWPSPKPSRTWHEGLHPNIPEIVAEVRELFERYETALEAKDVAVLDATFWSSPHTIRYALHENGYGFEAIHKHRVTRPPGPGIKEYRIRREILTLGRDLARNLVRNPGVCGRVRVRLRREEVAADCPARLIESFRH